MDHYQDRVNELLHVENLGILHIPVNTFLFVIFILCRDARLCVSEQRKDIHFYVLNFQRIDRPFFARRRTAVRLYKWKHNHNFGKVLTTFQQI